MTVQGNNIKNAFASIYGISSGDLPEIQRLTHEQRIEGLLQTLQSLVASPSATISGIQRTTGLIRVTNSGSIAVGALAISVANIGVADGLLKGVSIPAGTTINWSVNFIGDTLPATSYDATGTTFLITEVR